MPALDTACRVCHVVVDSIVANWRTTRDRIPE
jgi:purine nucleoside permease